MKERLKDHLVKGDGLLLVDVQEDFCPGGKLAIEEGDLIVPTLNMWIEIAIARSIPIYASRDWHPRRHVSFQEQGGQWPPHCLADSNGARFHRDLKVPVSAVIVTKGVRFDQDQNSVFDQTGFDAQLERDQVKRLWVGGLAFDVCVLASVLDAIERGFEVKLIKDATRPVTAAGGEDALIQMQKVGVEIV